VLAGAGASATCIAGRHLRANRAVVVSLDATIQRRWSARIKARGIYRDPVRSSCGHFVRASGLRWLCLMLLALVPWAGSV
jgi:hypothetical protein